MQDKIYTISLGCRLNAIESLKIKEFLSSFLDTAIIINTCAVTNEATSKSIQKIKKISKENNYTPIFITGCAVTLSHMPFNNIENVIIIDNKDKLNKQVYKDKYNEFLLIKNYKKFFIDKKIREVNLSKQFIRIQTGCNHICSYCITRILRGKSESVNYEFIKKDIENALNNNFYEIVLTGIDIASYNYNNIKLDDLCLKILQDFKNLKRLRIASIDPAFVGINNIIDLMNKDKRFMPHLHLSIQSCSDKILNKMRRGHTQQNIINLAKYNNITFSCDIICGFPGETEDDFLQTYNTLCKLKPIKIHAFPFSPRPYTEAFNMSDKIDKKIAKERVHKLIDLGNKCKLEFMKQELNKITSVLSESNNLARTKDDIQVKIIGANIEPKKICNVYLIGIERDYFIAKLV